jgi:hypothetical protein
MGYGDPLDKYIPFLTIFSARSGLEIYIIRTVIWKIKTEARNSTSVFIKIARKTMQSLVAWMKGWGGLDLRPPLS